jgi:hypothetical protein
MFQLPGDTEGVGDTPIPAAFIQPPIREGDALSSAAVGGEETLRRQKCVKETVTRECDRSKLAQLD